MGIAMERQGNRTGVTIPVGVISNGRRETAFMEDVSEGGFRLRGLTGAQIGQILRVHAKGAMIDAEIKWTDGPICGLQFRKESCASDLNRFRSQFPRLTKGKLKTGHMFQEMGVRHGM